MKIACTWIAEVMRAKACPSYEQVHYFPTLQKMGHDVKLIPIQPRESVNSELLDAVDYWKPDILFVKFYRTEIRKETIKYISENTGTTTVGIFGDDEKYFRRPNIKLKKDETIYTEEFAPCFNWAITTFKTAVKWYKKLGVNVIHSCYGANHWEYKKLNLKKIFDVSFCGARTPERIRLFNAIALSGIKLKVYGNGWNGEKSILAQSDYAALFSRTKINLNVSVDIFDGKRVLQIKGRDFEVPMCGGFILNRENPLLEDYFKIGEEIETYNSTQEMIDKIKYYLKNDSQRERIAENGYKRARKDHTYKKRFERILSCLTLKN